MYQKLNAYLAFQGMKYIKPEKAGAMVKEMLAFKKCGQEARAAFAELSGAVAEKVSPFEMMRVSQWANQAQVGRPHFWCYFKHPEDNADDVGLAIRLYGQKDDFGISVEVSFVERKKSEGTLAKQAQVLSVPIAEPLYYFVQENGHSYRVEGTEENRITLQQRLQKGDIRKVLVKYDTLLNPDLSLDEIVDQLVRGFQYLEPYYLATKK